ncbi:uncharacterized protein EAF01_000700 [Botrytis porri]|uniref:uncharacterized protein n=1 Tax=Botrytis porri TaxID=87229 RepID=UPI001901249D|nr:uncharacterized protein EAF01_000700 [Botrytis porri]KAF7914294.1 hypothetical protein EAF01_000700 [Botrytis porri]
MCQLILTFCPICSKVAAPSRVEKCANRSDPAHTPTTTQITAMNPCNRCHNLNKPSNPTRALTRDILEEMCMQIPEWHPTTPQEPIPGILPNWDSETSTRAQDEELFFEHTTRSHSVEIKNRQDLPSQRNGFPLCLVAGINQRPSPVNRGLERSRPERSKFTSPPLSWNNNPRTRRLGVAPAPSRVQGKSPIVSPPLRLQIPAPRPSFPETQDPESTPSSTTSTRSEYLLPGPSPQTETFSPVAFAQIPAHYDMRPTSLPTSPRISTTQPQVQVQAPKKHETNNQLPQQIQKHQEELTRQNLESDRMRELQQCDVQPRHVKDVEFKSVRPKGSFKLLRLSSFGSFRFDD